METLSTKQYQIGVMGDKLKSQPPAGDNLTAKLGMKAFILLCTKKKCIKNVYMYRKSTKYV